jgi:hypothetical protein
MRARVGRMVLCHMLADTSAELLAMADRIGVNRRWLQDSGTPREHFDVSLDRRRRALAAGAQVITRRELGMLLHRRRALATAPSIAQGAHCAIALGH